MVRSGLHGAKTIINNYTNVKEKVEFFDFKIYFLCFRNELIPAHVHSQSISCVVIVLSNQQKSVVQIMSRNRKLTISLFQTTEIIFFIDGCSSDHGPYLL